MVYLEREGQAGVSRAQQQTEQRSSLADLCEGQLLPPHVVSKPHKVKIGRHKDQSSLHQLTEVAGQHLWGGGGGGGM